MIPSLAHVYTAASLILAHRANPLGGAGVMMLAEAQSGRRPIQPGATMPFAFSADDWAFPQVVSVEGQEVRLVLIEARQPGNGAFRRLIDAIQAAGFTPVVIEPVGVTMPAIMAAWGWRPTTAGRGLSRVEEWRPPTSAPAPAVDRCRPSGSDRSPPSGSQRRAPRR